MRISDWSSDVCSSDLRRLVRGIGDALERIFHVLGGQLAMAPGPQDSGLQLELDVQIVDLLDPGDEGRRAPAQLLARLVYRERAQASILQVDLDAADHPAGIQHLQVLPRAQLQHAAVLRPASLRQRSEERRVGKECVGTWSSGWSP